jgi:Trk K+ transport system NAD-binding subunit
VIDIKTLNQHESLVELRTPKRFVGQTVEKANLFRHHHVHLLLVKPAESGDVMIPSADYQLNADDILLVMGENADVLAFEILM